MAVCPIHVPKKWIDRLYFNSLLHHLLWPWRTGYSYPNRNTLYPWYRLPFPDHCVPHFFESLKVFVKLSFDPVDLKNSLTYLSLHYFQTAVVTAADVGLSLISLGLGSVNVYKEHILYPKGKKDHIVLTMQNFLGFQQMSRASMMHPWPWNSYKSVLSGKMEIQKLEFYVFYRFFKVSVHEHILDNPDWNAAVSLSFSVALLMLGTIKMVFHNFNMN